MMSISDLRTAASELLDRIEELPDPARATTQAAAARVAVHEAWASLEERNILHAMNCIAQAVTGIIIAERTIKRLH